MNKIKFILTLFSLVISVSQQSFALDTKFWEDPALFVAFGKPTPKALCEVSRDLLFHYVFIPYDPEQNKRRSFDALIKKHCTQSDSSTNIPFPGWGGVVNYSARYTVSNGKTYYHVTLNFNKDTITLLDILGRYGVEFAEIETKSDLSKEISYFVSAAMVDKLSRKQITGNDHPLLNWAINGQMGEVEFVSFKFKSKDKVSVDAFDLSVALTNNGQK